MRYWQVTTRRFSTHAQKLEQDGNWHPFTSTPHSWYRVYGRKVIQRVSFSDAREAEMLFPLVQDLVPLQAIERQAGFREEIDIQLLDQGPALMVLLGYDSVDIGKLTARLRRDGIVLLPKDQLLYAAILLDSISQESLVLAQEKASAVRLLFQGVQQGGEAALAAAQAAYNHLMKELDRLPASLPKTIRKT
jgi:hypothetical protein